jgi:transaldolase
MMIKAPATAAGIEAMEALTDEGISINSTVSFSVAQAVAAAEAVERGLAKARLAGKDTQSMSPCITIMVGRVEDFMRKCVDKDGIVLDPCALSWSGPAVFKKAHRIFKERNYSATLLAAAYRHQLHWSELIGPGVVLSIPYAWWKKFDATNITLRQTLEQPVAQSVLDELHKIPAFTKLIDEDALRPEEFVRLGASQDTLTQFLGGLDDLRRWVRQEMLMGQSQ